MVGVVDEEGWRATGHHSDIGRFTLSQRARRDQQNIVTKNAIRYFQDL
jgi:hypothetical protein